MSLGLHSGRLAWRLCGLLKPWGMLSSLTLLLWALSYEPRVRCTCYGLSNVISYMEGWGSGGERKDLDDGAHSPLLTTGSVPERLQGLMDHHCFRARYSRSRKKEPPWASWRTPQVVRRHGFGEQPYGLPSIEKIISSGLQLAASSFEDFT